jgi:predicted AAA+ superfamily ATPase
VSEKPVADLIPRHLTPLVEEALRDTRVVAIVGARQAGKTTLARLLADRIDGAEFVSLDHPEQRMAAQGDPAAFIQERRGLLVIDEVQRAPELMLAIKASVDRDPRPGRFLLTGSAHFFAVRRIVDLLAGRIELFELGPLTQGEIEGVRERFVDAALEGELGVGFQTELGKRDYLRRACAGGFPEVLGRPAGRRRDAWFRSYVETVATREVPEIAAIDRIEELPRLLRLVAARHASLLNAADLARAAEIPERTVRRYLNVLEAVFLVRRVPAWSANLTKREVRQRKVLVTDAGLAAHLCGATPGSLADPTTSAGLDGRILEGFVIEEIIRQIGWSGTHPSPFHFRDRNGVEVDLVLEANDGRVAAVEVKAAGLVSRADFRHLALVRDRLGRRFRGGLVLHTGDRGFSFGDRLASLPIAGLWHHGSRVA